jgi:quinol monooxygenase YgiN
MSARLLVTALATLALVGLTQATAADQENPIVAAIKPQLKNPDKPFILAVQLQVKDGAGERFEAAVAKARRETRKEKGNLIYDLSHDAKDPSRYFLYEHWKSLADLETHLNADYIKALLAELPNLTTGQPEVRVLIPVSD